MNIISLDFEEQDNPFPEDDTYQDPDKDGNLFWRYEIYKSARRKKMRKRVSSRDGKMSIVIVGRADIHVQAYAGKTLGCGGFWGESLGTSVEEGINSALEGVKNSASLHLILLREGSIKKDKDEKIAKKILHYNGDIADLFKLVYFDYNKREVESQLGRYNRLEREIHKAEP